MKIFPFNIIYVCSPFSGKVEENKEVATKIAELIYKEGAVPITPHLLFPFMHDNNPVHRRDALDMDLRILAHCDEMWVLSGVITVGMSIEIDVANSIELPIRYISLEEVHE